MLDRWAKKFQVSARDAFGLIANVGEDCAGAVQFVRPERLDEVLSGAADHVEWLDEKEIAERLRLLREDHAAWRLPGDTGQFSLAGAQPKTALLLEGDRRGVPSGRLPTTHILKPPTGQFDGHAENEHVCLALARALGLPAATSQVARFAGSRCAEIDGVHELFRRMTFNALISNSDDHPRNHAILAKARNWRLSPAYDLTPNPQASLERRDLALIVGNAGRIATASNLVSQAARFLLQANEAEAIVDDMEAQVRARWYEHAREAGVSERDCELVAGAFAYPGFRPRRSANGRAFRAAG